MKTGCLLLLSFACFSGPLVGQEGKAGVDLRATLSGQTVGSTILNQPPRSGSSIVAGFRGVLYPTLKFNDNWAITGALQLYTRPYFFDGFSTQGYGAKGNVLQASLNYSRVSDKGSILARAGQLSTAFGSFLLRYDDTDNALINMPIQYGYYSTVSSLGLVSAELDATHGKWDGRVQFANSSPANPRSIFAHDQYGNWAGGGGYTIRQGLRVGVSAYRGPYLDRQYKYFFPGEAKPSSLPAHALGVDVGWSRGHWNVQGEYQQFVMTYKLIPTFREQAGYVEARRVLHPRWFVAARGGYTSANASGNNERYEVAVGFRPDTFQLIKVGYELDHSSLGQIPFENTVAVQFVTTLHRSRAN